jgi:hypothetical protein
MKLKEESHPPEAMGEATQQGTQKARLELYRRLVIEDGLRCTEVAKICVYEPEYGYQLNKKLKKNGQNKPLMSPRLFRKADQRAMAILDAQPWGTIESIKTSDVTSVISEVWKRKYPVKVESGVPALSFTTYNLNLIRPGHPDCIPLPLPVDNPPIDGDIAPITEDIEGGADEEV